MDQKEWKGLRTYALYCLVAAISLAVVFLVYFSRTKRNIQEQAEAQLAEVTRQYANAIKTDMCGTIQAVEVLAHVFGSLGKASLKRSSPCSWGPSIRSGSSAWGTSPPTAWPTPRTA